MSLAAGWRAGVAVAVADLGLSCCCAVVVQGSFLVQSRSGACADEESSSYCCSHSSDPFQQDRNLPAAQTHYIPFQG
jgi:hypothetical protein